MTDMKRFFAGKKANFRRLIHFGFVDHGDGCRYCAPLADGQFLLRVAVTGGGSVSVEVNDAATGDPYVLHRVTHATGPLVGRVREEYEDTLAAIADACFEADAFQSDGALAILRHVRERYGDEPEFLWKRFPGNAILRRKSSGKWYAAILRVRPKSLGFPGKELIEILDLRMHPDDVIARVDGRKYHPGYHMNKRHWVTIRLDGSLPMEEIFARLDESFVLAAR